MTQLDLRAAALAHSLVVPPPAILQRAVIATWHGRMIQEHGSSHVFDGLAAQLAAIGDHTDADECRAFAAEERAHGAMCGAVVEAAGGSAVATIAAPRPVPAHADTTPRAAVLRNIISVACLSETVAVALIGAERLEMPDGPLRDLLTRIWSDEVGHARFGWRYVERVLPELTADERAAVERYLPVALAALETHELAHLPINAHWPEDGATFGLCDGSDARELFYDTVTDVILPQLEALGLAAAHAWQSTRSVP
ncbi:MAG TPA: ferritin-like domain-containing protein [Kofleriaceae bacterium]|jgi:hypothetical protein